MVKRGLISVFLLGLVFLSSYAAAAQTFSENIQVNSGSESTFREGGTYLYIQPEDYTSGGEQYVRVGAYGSDGAVSLYLQPAGGNVLIGRKDKGPLGIEKADKGWRMTFDELRFYDNKYGDVLMIKDGSVGIGGSGSGNKLIVSGNMYVGGRICFSDGSCLSSANGAVTTSTTASTTSTTTTQNTGTASTDDSGTGDFVAPAGCEIVSSKFGQSGNARCSELSYPATCLKTRYDGRERPCSQLSPITVDENKVICCRAAACTDGEKRCSGTDLQTCVGGNWQNEACSAGCNSNRLECNVCVPGARSCSDANNFAICNAEGTGSEIQSCSAGMSCTGAGLCNPNCQTGVAVQNKESGQGACDRLGLGSCLVGSAKLRGIQTVDCDAKMTTTWGWLFGSGEVTCCS